MVGNSKVSEMKRTAVVFSLFVSLLLLPTIVNAQVSIVNALPEIPEKDTTGWKGSLSASFSWRDDNSRDKELDVGGGGSLTYRERNFLVHFVSRGMYQWLNEAEEEANLMHHVRFRLSLGRLCEKEEQKNILLKQLDDIKQKLNPPDYDPDWLEKLHVETFVQHEYDKFRSLDTRALAGIGPAYIIVASKHIDVMIGTAYMFEYLAFSGNIPHEANNRWSNYLQIEFDPVDTLSINSTTFAQFLFNDFDDHLISSTIVANVKITEWMSLSLGGGIDYDTRPPPGIKKFGSGVRAGVSFKW